MRCRKYFSIGDDRRFGGLYLWSSRAAKDLALRATAGQADATRFEVPLLVDATLRREAVP